MAKVPSSEQVVPSGHHPLWPAEQLLKRRGFLLGEELAKLIEASAGQALPSWLTEYLARHLRGKIKRPKGRRPTPKAALDFDLCRANGLYYQALSGYQRQVRERRSAAAKSRHRSRQHDHDNVSASQLAYEHVLRAMRKQFGNIDWTTLRNQLAEWRSGKFFHAEPDDGDDVFDRN
jgi:hypothetical protein